MHGYAQDHAGDRAAGPSLQPRGSVRCEDDGTWSALRGSILLATGLPTATAAWDVIDQAERASAHAPARPPAIARRARASWTAS